MLSATAAVVLLQSAAAAFELNAEPGSYILTGAELGANRGYGLALDPGTYILVGKDTRLRDSSVSTGIGPGFQLRRRRRHQKGES